MAGNRFDWDPVKDRRNLVKHGLSFGLATAVFDDPDELTENARVVDGEARLQTIGKVGQVILFVVHTARVGTDGLLVIRIISARVASRAERSRYER
ncbi:BrnT family toxin [Devosia sp. A8/3-2]|nr:BrnT family toxin [Devosia sp. A8/3-2]